MYSWIQWRIATAYVALIIAVVVGLGVYFVVSVQAQESLLAENQLARQASLVASDASAHLAPDATPSDVSAFARSIRESIGTRVTLVGPSGAILGDSDQDPTSIADVARSADIARALQLGASNAPGYGVSQDGEALHVAVPVRRGNEFAGVVRLGRPIGEVELQLTPFLLGEGGVSLLAVMVAIVTASFIARSSIAPLVRLTRQAERLAEGKAGPLIVVDAHDEVAKLVDAFNQLATKLRLELATSEEQRVEAATILAGMGDGVVIVDEDQEVVALNRAAEHMLEIAEGEARGKSVTEVVRRHEVAELVSTGKSPDGPLVVEVGRDRRQVQVVVTPVNVRETRRQLILFQDVTELRRAETIRRDFVANVSHELRTPLASLLALVETLEGGALDDPPAARDFLDRMHVEVDRLTQMVEELLELARIESGRVQLRFRKANVGKVVREAVERLRPQAERQNLSLTVAIPIDPVEAVVDADRLHQVVVNLVHNAVKFTPPGGSIGVGVEWRDNQVAISVADTGIGVSQIDLPRLFERFYKADRSRSSPGTGLGLAIVKHVVQLHSGTVRAESAGRGQGTTFIVTLPSGVGARGRVADGTRAARAVSAIASPVSTTPSAPIAGTG